MSFLAPSVLLLSSLTLAQPAQEPRAPASNNKGKIVAVWLGTKVPNLPAEVKLTMEFTADEKLVIKAAGPGGEKAITGKYRLLEGDMVEFYDLSEPISGSTKHKETITIKGDELTMTDSDGTAALFKKVEKKAPAPK